MESTDQRAESRERGMEERAEKIRRGRGREQESKKSKKSKREREKERKREKDPSVRVSRAETRLTVFRSP